MTRPELQLFLARTNIRKLIKRINHLEDRLDKLDGEKTLRPTYDDQMDVENNLPIA